MPKVTIRRGTKVALRGNTPNDVYEVQEFEGDNAVCRHLVSFADKIFPLGDLVAVAQRGDVECHRCCCTWTDWVIPI